MNWRLNFIFLDGLGARTRSSPKGGKGRLRTPAGDRRGLPCSGLHTLRAPRRGSRLRSAPRLGSHHAPSAYALARCPPRGWPSLQGELLGSKAKVPLQTCSPAGQRSPRRAGGAVRGEVSARLPATAATTESAGKVFSTRAGVSSAPGERAGSAAPGPSVPARGARSARKKEPDLDVAVPHNLAPGHPGPPPQHRPRVPAGAPSCRGYCGGPAGVHPARRGAVIQDFPPGVRPIPGLSRPPAAPTFPRSRARAARGGRRGRAAPGGGEQSEEERAPSPERSPLQLQPWSTPSFPPRRTRRWRRQPRKEEPVPQRRSALPYRPPRA